MLETLPSTSSPPELELTLKVSCTLTNDSTITMTLFFTSQTYNDYGQTYSTLQCDNDTLSGVCDKYRNAAQTFSVIKETGNATKEIIDLVSSLNQFTISLTQYFNFVFPIGKS